MSGLSPSALQNLAQWLGFTSFAPGMVYWSSKVTAVYAPMPKTMCSASYVDDQTQLAKAATTKGEPSASMLQLGEGMVKKLRGDDGFDITLDFDFTESRGPPQASATSAAPGKIAVGKASAKAKPKVKKFPCAVAAYSALTLLHVKQLEVRREGIKALSCLRRQRLCCSQAMQCINDRIPLDGSPGVLTACASLRTSTMKRYNALWKNLEVAASAAGELLTKAEAWLRRAMCRQ